MNFIKKITRSGVALYVLPMPEAHTVASGVLVNVGSRDEQMLNEAGLAHSFEHLFFQGTKSFPTQKELTEYIEKIGGVSNAFTSYELTFFHNQVPFKEFENGINMLSEQIQHSLIPEDKISKEIKVILHELKQRIDVPTIRIWDLTFETIFFGHPLGHSVIGTEQSLLNLKKGDFINFLNRYYNSANFTFLIAGNITTEQALENFNKYFNKKDGEKNIRASASLKEKLESEKIFYKDINQLHINLAAPISNASLKEKWALNLFANMIGRGLSSPLFQEIRDTRGLCYTVNASYYWGTDYGLFKIYLATSKEKQKDAIGLALDVIKKNKDNAELLEKAKKIAMGELARQFENPLDIIKGAAYTTTFTGTPHGFKEVEESVKDISIKDIKNAVKKYLNRENFTSVILAPEK